MSLSIPRAHATKPRALSTLLVAVGLASGTIAILDARSGRQVALLDQDSTPMSSLVFRVDGRLSVGRADGRVDILDVSAAS